jgi:transcriptional regulator with XRE-family HTH domain
MSSSTRRRTPGLRREEVAQLAGIGITWYTWLEQGREINVSDSILDSLSRVFLLTDEERVHLYTLANKSLPPQGSDSIYVNDRILHLFEKLDLLYCPAYIIDNHWNIVKWNKFATRIFGDFSQLPSDNQNMIYLMFNNQDYISLFEQWEIHAKEMLSRFHITFAKNIDDPWFNDFIQRMKKESERFSSWWTLYDVNSMTDIIKHIKHPEIGNLTFDFVTLDIVDNYNLKMLIYNPDDKTTLTLKELDV